MKTGRLGSILIRAGKLNEAQLADALVMQNGSARRLGEILVDSGAVIDEDVALALAEQMNIPFFELGEEFALTREEVALVPEAVARRFCLIPLRRGGEGVVTVVMRDPANADALDAVRALTRLEVHKAVSTAPRILAVIDRFYREDAHLEQNIRDLVDLEALSGREGAETPVDSEQLRVIANDAPVVRFVNLLLMSAVRDGASDIHFEPGEKGASVRLRIDGYLREVTPPPKSLYQAVVTRLKILASMDIGERRLPLDGRFKFKVADRVIDVRVSSLPEAFGEKIVLRLLDRASLIVDMRDIGFEGERLARFQRILKMPYGIILLTGPTGSGKTTTLYSALNYLREPSVNIQTVEDPVEYMIGGINQMQVKEKIGLDFASALRSILRQDPDIIMIGEIRDAETAQMAMRASLTGHLVLSTLHTNDAVSAISRLRDIGIAPYLVAATVNLVISQRLVRRVCSHCAKPQPETSANIDLLRGMYPDATSWTFQRGAGCERCGHTGYKGRIALMEFLEITDDIRRLILDQSGDVAIRAKAVEQGMVPLARDGAAKVRDGVTTMDEVAAVWPMDSWTANGRT